MKAVAIAACLCLVAAEAQAISRYDPTRMSCEQVHGIIAREGAVILRYRSPRSGMTLYDRYVSTVASCERGEVRDPRTVPSADTASCPVYSCKQAEFDDPMRRFMMPGD